MMDLADSLVRQTIVLAIVLRRTGRFALVILPDILLRVAPSPYFLSEAYRQLGQLWRYALNAQPGGNYLI